MARCFHGFRRGSTFTILGAVTLALSTVSLGGSPSDFSARAARLGFRDVALDASLDAASVAVLSAAILGAGLGTVVVEAPCPRPPDLGGERPPYLASADREERLAATKDFEATVATATRLGAKLIIVRLGVLDVQHHYADTLRAYARRTLDDEARERLVATRRQLSGRALDLARFGLEPVLERAAAAGVTVGLVNRPRWFDIASAAEVATLLGELRGAPLAPFYDAAAAHVRAALGLGPGRPAVELERAAGAFLTDAAGVRGGLPWGTGEVERAEILAKLPAEAPRVLRSAIATDEELLSALTS
jgi:hypothetical protein